MTLTVSESTKLSRLGAGDPKKARAYLQAIAAFLEGKPENTKLTYRAALKQFFELFDWISPENVTVAEAAYFKKWLMRRGMSDATVYARLSACQSFFKFLMQPQDASSTEGLIKTNPFSLITRSDVKPTPYGRSVPVEWENLKKCLDGLPMDATGLRDKAILLFFAFSGRRKAEIANLRIRDLDIRSSPKSYTVMAKRHKTQVYELPEIAYDAIRAYWLASGRLSSLHPDAGVFTAAKTMAFNAHLDPDRPISPRLVTDILKRSAYRAQIDPSQMKVHGLRHMAARDLDRAGVRLQDIQAFLGQANPNTTAIYISAINRKPVSQEETLLKIRNVARSLGEKFASESDSRE